MDNQCNHILIVGEQGVGKSTLIHALLKTVSLPLYGFRTQKSQAVENGDCPVYLTLLRDGLPDPAPLLVGYGTKNGPVGNADAFDLAGEALKQISSHCLVLLDELGVMENGAQGFQQAVLDLLAGKNPLIAAVKNRKTPFLDAVRAQAGTQEYCITRENRDALRLQLLEKELFL